MITEHILFDSKLDQLGKSSQRTFFEVGWTTYLHELSAAISSSRYCSHFVKVDLRISLVTIGLVWLLWVVTSGEGIFNRGTPFLLLTLCFQILTEVSV